VNDSQGNDDDDDDDDDDDKAIMTLSGVTNGYDTMTKHS
jgi:hypothetical protein